MGKTESIENVTKLKNMKVFFVLSLILAFLSNSLFLSCNNGSEKIVYVPVPAPNNDGGVTAYGGGTQTGIVTSVTESSIVEEIKKMTESGTVKASGVFDSKLIEDVRKAIVYLADERPNVLVTLDLSAVKGLSTFSFKYCKNLAGIVLPNDKTNMTSIGSFAFYRCAGLASVTIPGSVTSIGDYAFSECAGLASVTIPGSVTSIGVYAFSECTGLASCNYTGTLEQWCKISFRSYDSNPCYYAKKLCIQGQEIKDLVIPDGVTSIGSYAFYGCTGLTSVTIPSGVTSIGSSAFSGCTGLASVTIPGSVTSIGDSAFYGCSGLTSCNYTGTLAQWCNISFRSYASNPCYCAKKLCIQGQEIKDLVIPDGVTRIGSYAFYGCSGLTSVTIPSGVTIIGYMAFYGCKNLANAIFSDTSGWCYSSSGPLTDGTAINSASLADSTNAASYLRDTYCRYYWYKKN